MEISYCDPMAFNALLRLRRDREHKHKMSWRAVSLGMVIASFANQDGEAWPSRATLERITGIDGRDIRRVIHELRDAGFMAIEERKGQSNIYRMTYREITPGCLASCGKSPRGEKPFTRGEIAAKHEAKHPPITIYRTIKEQVYTRDDEKPPSYEDGMPSVADAEKLVDLYAELVKPKRDDASGSHKIFLATAKRLLSEGKPFSELERSIRNYAASRKQREKRPDEVQFRWGFQTFFGPKNEHWRDFLAVDQESTAPASASILPRDPERDADPLWLQYHVEQVEKKHGEDMARRYDAIGRKRKSIEAADEWLKREIECRTA